MNITIIGAGNVGKALAQRLDTKKHKVTFGVKDPTKDEYIELTASFDSEVKTTALSTSDADLIILAVPWSAVVQVSKELQKQPQLKNKVLIDATNPLKPDLSGLNLESDKSGGEIVQDLFPQLNVVKAFNTTGAENMQHAGDFGAKPLMLLAGNDDDSKSLVKEVTEQIGFDAVDAGGLEKSLLLEYLALNWISLAYTAGLGTQFAFSVVRR